jgi:uncharacterized protein
MQATARRTTPACSAQGARVAQAVCALALAVALAAPASSLAAAAKIPPLSGPVVDEAGILDARGRSALDALSRAAWDQPAEKRVQLQYLLVRSLEGDDIESYAVRVFEAWKLGEAGRDNGVLVVVAVEDRRVRIETGYGTEGGLTDAQSGRIIRQTITPAFRAGAYAQGLHEAGVQILGALGALPQNVRPRQSARPGAVPPLGASAMIVLAIMFFVMRVLTSFGPRRRFSGRRGGWGTFGGPFGGMGGGLGGFGGGGGGWGGGGGRSGGGGASGGW